MSMPDEAVPEGEPVDSERKPFEKKSFFDKKLSDRPERFEDFSAWQEARRLTNRLYDVTDKPELATDTSVRDALRRAAVEVMSQLAAAVEGGGEREFIRNLNLAKASAAAVRSLVYVAIDRNYLTEQESTELQGRSSSIGRMIGSQLARLKRAETEDFKRKGGKPGAFTGRKPGGFGPKKPYGSGPPKGDRPGKPKFRPKRDE